MNINKYPITDFSGGVQGATSWPLRKPNQLARGANLRFNGDLGSINRRDGNATSGNQFSTIPTAPTGGHIAKFSTGNVPFVACNNDAGTATIIRTQNTGTGVWTTLSGITYPVNSVIFFLDYLDEVYISGFDPVTGDPVTPYNVDKTLDVSSTRNILYMPPGYFMVEYLGILYSCNVKLGAVRYTDRFYKGSPPLGYATTIQGAQTDVATAVALTDQVPTMTANNAPLGTALASTEANAANQAYMAFDNDMSNKWTANATTGTIQYDFGSGNTRIITYYSIVGAISGQETYAPKTWTFEGSNNGSSWTTLDARTNVATWAGLEKRTYAVNNTTAYRYYRLNITANQGASLVTVVEFELLVSTSTSKDLQWKVDSVRYVKPGMTFDIYKGGTETKLYTMQVATVDKPNNILTFTPYTNQFLAAAVTTAADTITLTGLGTLYPTGTPIRFQSNNTLPAPLVSDTTYYAIYVDANTIKVATNLTNAQTGVAIDLTTQGTGPHYILYSYVVSDNDELWLTGRKGKLTVFWNVDYPIPEATEEWFALKPGTDSANTITGASKSSNRLFVYGRSSGTRWDGSNLVVFNNSVGCISHRSIGNIDDDWIVWLDAKGNIWARNESSGQQQKISKPIQKVLKKFTQTQLKAATCVVSDNSYQLYLGTNSDGENVRVFYDFDGNTWSVDRCIKPIVIYGGTSDITGVVKPYFFSNDGYMYIDETGNSDGGKAIPFEMGYGQSMLDTERVKRFWGVRVFSSGAAGNKLEASVDGGPFKVQGEITGKVCTIPFPETGDDALRRGVTIDFQIMSSMEGDGPQIDAVYVYYVPEEDVPGATKQ